MVIPYLPMLIPPQNWTGYEIFSPIIRTYIVPSLLWLYRYSFLCSRHTGDIYSLLKYVSRIAM